ncbi:Type II inositol-3,4-bisphosphate 4-phosphatase, partial [Cricetulus griseus]
TSDGGKVVGTIEVSLVKMGEIEDGDTDHITTVVQGQKCALAYECAAPDSVSGKDSLPLLNAGNGSGAHPLPRLANPLMFVEVAQWTIAKSLVQSCFLNTFVSYLQDRVWANMGKSLNCIIATVDKLIERDGHNKEGGGGSSSQDGDMEASLEDSITSHPKEDWYEQLHPLIITLKECMGEVVSRAKQSLTFVLLQELAYSLPQCLMLTLRRDIVFSQALAGLVCGFIIKLHTSLHDPYFLQQLHTVGLIVQYEGLLSTYSDEIGMLEDMAVGISDLRKVAFKITEAKSSDDLPVLTGRREHYVVEVKLPATVFESLPLQIKEGQLLHVYPVLFNVGINEQQTLAERFGDVSLQESINQENFELLQEYFSIFMEKMPPDYISHFQEQNDLKGLLDNLHQNIQAKKRKNVEIMWLAATICRKLNGIRFTCCKSAKDRTSMSVTLEQCSILRDEHQLHKDFFIRALDCMRRNYSTKADDGMPSDYTEEVKRLCF